MPGTGTGCLSWTSPWVFERPREDLVVEPVPRPSLTALAAVVDSDLLRGVSLPPGYVTSLAAPLRRTVAVGAVTPLDAEHVAAMVQHGLRVTGTT